MPFKNEAELNLFFNQEYDNILLIALRILKNTAEAEDMVQDCFIKMWNTRDTLNLSGSSSAYLKRMVRNKCIDVLRSKKDSIQFIENISDFDNIIQIENNGQEDKFTLVNNTIDNLPEKCRQIFVLSKFENMTYKEISEKLNLSQKTVENQISIALKKIRNSLKQILLPFF
jgi:RNA polymerase sigma-70 factor (ECF subfamily)